MVKNSVLSNEVPGVTNKINSEFAPSHIAPDEAHEAHITSPNVGIADPTDGREKYQWKSSYPEEAKRKIRLEAFYLSFVFFATLVFILLTWKGITADWLNVAGKPAEVLRKYSYYVAAGTLGGSVFSIKFMYRVVARGYWHVDRQMWRYLTPVVSFGVAFAGGALIEASMFSGRPPLSGAAIVGTGFLIGYFADQAIAKMYEVANVIFGATNKSTENKSEK